MRLSYWSRQQDDQFLPRSDWIGLSDLFSARKAAPQKLSRFDVAASIAAAFADDRLYPSLGEIAVRMYDYALDLVPQI